MEDYYQIERQARIKQMQRECEGDGNPRTTSLALFAMLGILAFTLFQLWR